jgi:hypothetical protein
MIGPVECRGDERRRRQCGYQAVVARSASKAQPQGRKNEPPQKKFNQAERFRAASGVGAAWPAAIAGTTFA